MLAAASNPAQQVPDPDFPPNADLLPYAESKGRMTVPIRINGTGPYDFLVDTGSERTVISKELAETLQLGAGPRTRMHSVTGTDRVATVIIPTLEMSRRTVRRIAAPSLPQIHIGASGMLGIDSLKNQHVVFDFAAKRMALTPHAQPAEGRSSAEIVVTARTRLGRLVLADATIHGRSVVVILDTGAEVSIGNDALRRKLGAMGKLGETQKMRLVSISGTELDADYTSVGKATIGNLHIDDMPIAFGRVPLFDELGLEKRPAMLLGMDVLSLFDRVTVNFPRRQVRFRLPAKPKPDTLASR